MMCTLYNAQDLLIGARNTSTHKIARQHTEISAISFGVKRSRSRVKRQGSEVRQSRQNYSAIGWNPSWTSILQVYLDVCCDCRPSAAFTDSQPRADENFSRRFTPGLLRRRPACIMEPDYLQRCEWRIAEAHVYRCLNMHVKGYARHNLLMVGSGAIIIDGERY